MNVNAGVKACFIVFRVYLSRVCSLRLHVRSFLRPRRCRFGPVGRSPEGPPTGARALLGAKTRKLSALRCSRSDDRTSSRGRGPAKMHAAKPQHSGPPQRAAFVAPLNSGAAALGPGARSWWWRRAAAGAAVSRAAASVVVLTAGLRCPGRPPRGPRNGRRSEHARWRDRRDRRLSARRAACALSGDARRLERRGRAQRLSQRHGWRSPSAGRAGHKNKGLARRESGDGAGKLHGARGQHAIGRPSG